MRGPAMRRLKTGSLEMHVAPIGRARKGSGEESVLEIAPRVGDGLHGIAAGDHLQVLYWMHQLQSDARKALEAHPQGNRNRPLKGVFGLRSPMRPNPIGVSTVRVTRVEQNRLFVSGLDAMDGSPIVDIKGSGEQSR